MAEVSTVPGRSCEKSCHSRLFATVPEAMISEIRAYGLPTAPLRFSQRGWAGSWGGWSGAGGGGGGEKKIGGAPQPMPMRKGGSIDGSARWLTRESGFLGSVE